MRYEDMTRHKPSSNLKKLNRKKKIFFIVFLFIEQHFLGKTHEYNEARHIQFSKEFTFQTNYITWIHMHTP